MKLLGWLGSVWKWIGRNKSLTCVIVFVVGLVVFGVLMVCLHWEWIVTESGSTIIRNLGLVIGGLIAIGFGVWRGVVASRQAETAQRGLLNERYQKGAEMLGSDLLAVRLGGIYALQRLAEENAEQYHIQIMRLLCAFVRHPTGDKDRDENNNGTDTERQPDNKDYPVREDVHAAMKAIGTRSSVGIEREQEEDFYLDLSGAHLVGAHLNDAHLNSARLEGARLDDADLNYAHLNRARLGGAHLNSALLNYAHLNRARLEGAHLNRARLEGARLNSARLNGAHLNGAHLNGAYLNDAHLDDAHLVVAHLNGAHLNRAYLNDAHLDDAHLVVARLDYAHLNRARLEGARLNRARLNGAHLNGAYLNDANLTAAKLSKAKGLTQQQLDQAVAMSNSPPELGGLRDADTGDLLARISHQRS